MLSSSPPAPPPPPRPTPPRRIPGGPNGYVCAIGWPQGKQHRGEAGSCCRSLVDRDPHSQFPRGDGGAITVEAHHVLIDDGGITAAHLMTVFAGAVDATFVAFGIDAVYTPAGGEPVPVRVIARPRDAIVGFGDTGIHAETATFESRASDLPNRRGGAPWW